MSETVSWNTNKEQLHQPLTREELIVLGDEVIRASGEIDMSAAVAEHIDTTGLENPNQITSAASGDIFRNMSFTKDGVGVDTTSESVYRGIDRRALQDLAESGVVRGKRTATGGVSGNTTGDATFWHEGEDGKKLKFMSPGHVVIEAPKDHAESGWVTADQVTGIYAQDDRGTVHNIISRDA